MYEEIVSSRIIIAASFYIDVSWTNVLYIFGANKSFQNSASFVPCKLDTYAILERPFTSCLSQYRGPRYQIFCCKIESAVIKNLDMDPSKARIMDSFEQFLTNHIFVYLLESPRGDSNKYPKVCFLKNNETVDEKIHDPLIFVQTELTL